MEPKSNNLVVENARMIWPNFAGQESRYNQAGVRNFCLILSDPEMATTLKKAGWNIKYLNDPKEETKKGTGDAYTQIRVSFDNRPPKIIMIAGDNRTVITEETVALLDHAEVIDLDVLVAPFNWSSASGTGIKGYLREMYITIEQSVLSVKHNDFANTSREEVAD